MHMLRLGAAALLALAASAPAAPTVLGAPQQPPAQQSDAAIRSYLDSLRQDPNGLTLSAADVRSGPRAVAPGEHVAGDVVSWHGPLDVRGTVDGNAVAIGGDVVVHQGGVVRGSALAVGGEARLDGGTVGGELRSLSGLSVGPLRRAHLTPAQATKRSLSLSVGWYLVLAVIGLAVALFARTNLELIAETIREDYSRAFLYGLAGELAIAPLLIIGCIALAITIIGALLIPFAIPAYIFAVCGAMALGFLAMAFVTGDAVMRRRDAAPGYASPVMQYLFIGLSLYFILWFIGSAFTWAGLLGSLLRLIATAITWAAATVGFGATILSRAGTRPAAPRAVPRAPTTTEEYAWQTPTPVTGVTAARRPTPAPRTREP